MVTFKGNPIALHGSFVSVGQQAPDFELVAQNLDRLSLSAYEGQIKILSIFPSVDTGVCAKMLKEFQVRTARLKDVVVLNISKGLPFAQSRFCGAEHLGNAVTLSAFDSSFGEDYGLLIKSGPLKGLLSRAVILLDTNNKVLYAELVHEITEEPNYGRVFEFLENSQSKG